MGLALLLCLAACRDKTDEFVEVDRCLRDHQAREVPAPFQQLAERRGWRMQRLALGSDRVLLLGTPTDSAADEARSQVVEAQDALRDPFATDELIVVQKRGNLVYWWETQPSSVHVALLADCVG